MDKEKWIQEIREKLLHHRTVVPQSLWGKIEEQLPTPPITWLKSRYLYIAAAVATLLIVVSLTLLTPNAPVDKNNYTAENTTTECPNNICNSTSGHIHSTDTDANVPSNLSAPISHTLIAQNSTETSNKLQATTTTTINNNKTTIKEQQPATTTSTTQQSFNTSPNNNCCKDNEADDVDPNVPLINYCNKHDSCYDEITEKIIKQIKKKETSMHLLAFEANTSNGQSTTIPLSFRNEPLELIFHHYMPLNVKVLFEKRFDKWSIGTGVSYTYLTAHYEMAENLRNGKQELHYIGIPLYAGYEFARIKRFSFYTTLGGQVDFNTDAIHTENSNSHVYPCFKQVKFRDKKAQFSAQLHLGIAFQLIDHLDLYAEPSLGYYFQNGSKIHSLWHDHPWNIGLSIGLRTSF